MLCYPYMIPPSCIGPTPSVGGMFARKIFLKLIYELVYLY